MPAFPGQHPFHEPVGFSPEGFDTSKRWILTFVVALLVLAAGIVTAIRG